MRARHFTRQLASCLAALALLTQCGADPAGATSARQPLRIGIDLWAGYYPLVLADDLGYLREEGVEVDVSIPKNTDRMLANFAAGDYDGVCVSIGDVITLTRNVDDLRLILLSDESSGGDQVLARTPVTGAEQLRGKRVGTNLGGFGELFVRRLLDKHGVAPDEVQWVDLDAADVPARLADGDIDIGHTWEPYASLAIAKGMHLCFTSADTPGLILDGLIVRGAAAQNRGDDLRHMTKAWLRAVEWWRTNPAEGDRRIETRLGLPKGEARPVGIKILDRQDNHALMSGDGGLAPLGRVAGQYIDFFVSRGLMMHRPEPGALFDPTFLP